MTPNDAMIVTTPAHTTAPPPARALVGEVLAAHASAAALVARLADDLDLTDAEWRPVDRTVVRLIEEARRLVDAADAGAGQPPLPIAARALRSREVGFAHRRLRGSTSTWEQLDPVTLDAAATRMRALVADLEELADPLADRLR